MPTCRIPTITTGQRSANPLAPAAAAAAALLAACVVLAIIWLRSAIRSCMAASRAPAGGWFRCISLACLLRSCMLLKKPMGQLAR